MLPFLSTATVMFSGLVCVGMFTALGKSTFTVLLMTGIVMRKMMSNTNITSTRGVVLMFDITDCSSPDPDQTLIAIVVATRASHAHLNVGPTGKVLIHANPSSSLRRALAFKARRHQSP